ncbi:delta(3,5)-Delta(2,4)-dienoyl-CoA isomerase, mitochondrial isoform X2 [Aotus nancymaae]|uniref:delta(3,5)-Delta(2,4)-dienoyl-CoA isomerase, mitochondrial isoform X2 n=1 Tax=Aotus nancymaae TaxID=37293 RepID=UPI0030FF344A
MAGAMAAGMVASRRLGDLLTRRLTASNHPGLSISLRLTGSSAQQEASRVALGEAPDHSYESLRVTSVQKHVLHVQLNRPDKRNAMNRVFWREMVECFNKISRDADCRAVVISGAGKMFTAGIDLMDMASDIVQPKGDDVARISWYFRDLITRYQETFTVIEKCPKPVIAAVHGGCIGGGVDLVTACDIRYCAQDAFFQVKEVDMGLAADVGTLQRLPRVIGSQSLVNELAFTARKMMADEALGSGLVRRLGERALPSPPRPQSLSLQPGVPRQGSHARCSLSAGSRDFQQEPCGGAGQQGQPAVLSRSFGG